MSYRLVVERAALKALADLKKHPLYSQIRSTVEGLAQTPRPPNCIKLTNSQLWRVPVGTYRILYTIEDAAHIVIVLDIGHRRDIYRTK